MWELTEGVSHPFLGIRKCFLEETKSNLKHKRGIRNLVGRQMRNEESGRNVEERAALTQTGYVREHSPVWNC